MVVVVVDDDDAEEVVLVMESRMRFMRLVTRSVKDEVSWERRWGASRRMRARVDERHWLTGSSLPAVYSIVRGGTVCIYKGGAGKLRDRRANRKGGCGGMGWYGKRTE